MVIAFDSRAWTKPPHSFRRVLRLLVDAVLARGWEVELWRTDPFQEEFREFEPLARDARRGTPESTRAEVLWSPQMDVLPSRLPTVATIHDVNPLLEDGRGMLSRWARRRKFMRLLRDSSPQVGCHATDTEDARARISGFFPELAGSIEVVPLYVESTFTSPVVRRGNGLGLAPGYFLFVGSLRRHKNWHGLIRAYAGLPAALRRERALVLAGPAHRSGPEARRLAASLGVGDQVRFTGVVADADLPGLYAGARAFVFPSFLEGFGLPPLEAMALGVPVISSNRTCLPEVLGDAPLYIDPDDLPGLSAAMERLGGEDDLCARLSSAGRDRSRQFNPERTATAMERAVIRAQARAG